MKPTKKMKLIGFLIKIAAIITIMDSILAFYYAVHSNISLVIYSIILSLIGILVCKYLIKIHRPLTAITVEYLQWQDKEGWLSPKAMKRMFPMKIIKTRNKNEL